MSINMSVVSVATLAAAMMFGFALSMIARWRDKGKYEPVNFALIFVTVAVAQAGLMAIISSGNAAAIFVSLVFNLFALFGIMGEVILRSVIHR